MVNFLFLRHLRQIDWILIGPVFLLVVFGLVAQYSLSSSASGEIASFSKQLIIAMIGLIAVIFLAGLDFRLIKPFAILLYFLLIFILVLTLLFGQSFHGTKGWLGLGEWQFQVV